MFPTYRNDKYLQSCVYSELNITPCIRIQSIMILTNRYNFYVIKYIEYILLVIYQIKLRTKQNNESGKQNLMEHTTCINTRRKRREKELLPLSSNCICSMHCATTTENCSLAFLMSFFALRLLTKKFSKPSTISMNLSNSRMLCSDFSNLPHSLF